MQYGSLNSERLEFDCFCNFHNNFEQQSVGSHFLDQNETPRIGRQPEDILTHLINSEYHFKTLWSTDVRNLEILYYNQIDGLYHVSWLDSSVIDEMQREVDQKETSLNVLVNQVLKRYTD